MQNKEVREMATFKGLVYVKHGRVGSKSEGPDYYLQTKKKELILQHGDREPWKPDYKLEFFNRRMVEVEGEPAGDNIVRVKSIHEIPDALIPD
jgi:hypothetical protein